MAGSSRTATEVDNMTVDKEQHDQAYYYETDDPRVRLSEKLEHLRASLCLEMMRLRKEKGLTQAEMGERMGIGQPQVSKLENPDIESSLESITRYVHELGAELAVGVKTREGFVQVSDGSEYELKAMTRAQPQSGDEGTSWPKRQTTGS